MENRNSLKKPLGSYGDKTENKDKRSYRNEADDARVRLEKLSTSVDELSKTLVLLAKLVSNRSKRKKRQENTLLVKNNDITTNRIDTVNQEQAAYNKTKTADKRVSYKKSYYKKATKKDYQTDFILH